MFDNRRMRLVKEGEKGCGPVIYWMSRDQRAEDNWALLYAQQTALAAGMPLGVMFHLQPTFLGGGYRQFAFKVKGLMETESRLTAHNIAFALFVGDDCIAEMANLVKRTHATCVVSDFSPLRIGRDWLRQLSAAVSVPVYEVDAHNIVPCWLASPKQEVGAYTIRRKLHRLLPEFLTPLPPLQHHVHAWGDHLPGHDWRKILDHPAPDRSVAEVRWLKPGSEAARHCLKRFLNERLAAYADARNDPAAAGQSELSPYFHFGHIAPQRVAWEVQQTEAPLALQAAFLEELIVRRELADNFCFYNDRYDSLTSLPAWAQKTLAEHRGDARPYLYSRDELENARTHDILWNGAQREMVERGKMHGYLRMYWAKKILEWSETPEQALATAIYLNDRYQLDGRDANGYTGIAWSIGGVHDRPWPTRPVFGKIRYMSFDGCKRKFRIDDYLRQLE